MNRDKHPIPVTSAFIEKNGKFLLVLDPKFGFWRVPGGRIEGGEKAANTLIREMKEEIGILVSRPRFLGFGQDIVYHWKLKRNVARLILYYHVKITQEPRLDPREARDHRWVTVAQMKRMKKMEGAMKDFFRLNPKLWL